MLHLLSGGNSKTEFPNLSLPLKKPQSQISFERLTFGKQMKALSSLTPPPPPPPHTPSLCMMSLPLPACKVSPTCYKAVFWFLFKPDRITHILFRLLVKLVFTSAYPCKGNGISSSLPLSACTQSLPYLKHSFISPPLANQSMHKHNRTLRNSNISKHMAPQFSIARQYRKYWLYVQWFIRV